MKFQELVILLPCHSLEDFPVYAEGEEAEGLLAAWTSLWHPALIHSAQSMPTWCRMDDPPEHLDGRLLVIPPVSHTELPTGFYQRAKETGACPIRRKLCRDEIVNIALEALDEAAEVDDELVRDFFALGFAYLQVQILTRQMRYSSNLDEVHFANQVVAAANAAAQGEREAADEKLTACFDLLSEERDLFYSVDSFLIDLVMVTPSTLGKRFQSELDSDSPISLLLSAGVVDSLRGGDLAGRVAELWTSGKIGLLACDGPESALALLPMEAAARHVKLGRDQVNEAFGQPPKVFGRRRYGLTPSLPQLLRKLSVPYALHATLEDGRFPEGSQIKTLWEGGDRSTVDTLCKAPLNASLPETFLGMALKTGETMDMDHVATLVLAHWPGTASPYLNDLRRAAKRTSALGQFVTIDQYFETTDESHDSERFPPSRSRSPYLRQAVIRRQPKPLSRWLQYHTARARAAAAGTMMTLAGYIDRKPRDSTSQHQDALDDQCESPDFAVDQEALSKQVEDSVESLNQALRLTSGDGVIVWNPHTSIRRVLTELPGFEHAPAVEGPVYAAEAGQSVKAVVDVPPMGYVHLSPPSAPARQRGRPDPVLVEGPTLQNEFMEVHINERSGGVGSLQSYTTRGNRLSQQLAMRLPGEAGERAAYTTMIAEQIETVTATRLEGAIRATGRLINAQGEKVAAFTQTTRVTRGSRVLELDIELDEIAELKSDPWNSYVANRIAWPDEASTVACDVNQVRHGMGDRKRLDATHYVEVSNSAYATTIFPNGLPYHRRVGLASLDSLLVVRGEDERRFRMGIGVDVAYPLQEAIALAAPPVTTGGVSAPTTKSAWLSHVQAKNVVATRWLPRMVDGKTHGFQVHLLEASGRAGQIKLQSLRPIRAAQIIDLDGNTLADCRVEDGAAHLEIAAREWLIVAAEWDE